jgi:hypothetical protein
VTRTARAWFAVNAVVVVVALAIQIPITAAATEGVFDTPAARVANLFTFFTILSNILVAAVCLVLAARPGHRSPLFAVVWLDGLLAIAVTGIVYNTVLIGLYELRGAELVADRLFHMASPALFVLGWLLFGPRGLVTARTVALSLLYPLLWLAFTLVRGAIISWYPYPFLQVPELGYGRVTLNSLLITSLFLALAAAVVGMDRILGRTRRAVPQQR